MSSQVSYFRVGIFVILGFFLGAAALVLFGAEDYLRPEGFVFETYLDESVEGLDVGSPVKYRGVRVGAVDDIDFVRNLYPEAINLEEFDPFGSYVVVRVQLEPDVFEDMSYEAVFRLVQREAQNGLRAILTPKGLTGTAYLEIDYRDPEHFPGPSVNWKPKDIYLPSATSTLRRFATGLDEILTKLVDADIDAAFSEAALLLSSVRSTNERIRDILNDPAVDDILTDAAAATKGVRETVEGLGSKAEAALDGIVETGQSLTALADRLETILEEGRVVRGLEDVEATLRSAREAGAELSAASSEARAALYRLDRLVGDMEPDVGAMVVNLRAVSENLRALSEVAERYPSFLLFGEPPQSAGD